MCLEVTKIATESGCSVSDVRFCLLKVCSSTDTKLMISVTDYLWANCFPADDCFWDRTLASVWIKTNGTHENPSDPPMEQIIPPEPSYATLDVHIIHRKYGACQNFQVMNLIIAILIM